MLQESVDGQHRGDSNLLSCKVLMCTLGNDVMITGMMPPTTRALAPCLPAPA